MRSLQEYPHVWLYPIAVDTCPSGSPAGIHTHWYAPARKAPGRSQTEQIVHDLISIEGMIALPLAYRIAKRALDVVTSGLLLLLLSPVFLVLGIVIRRDSPGPVFFLQERVGHLGRPFQMIKFRTMTPGSMVNMHGGIHKQRRDPRVTKVGTFLRATSLDELPQLINVFKGEMSLVGPRPEIAEIVRAYYEPWQYERFLVPQGISGWWQVTGRGAKLLREHTADDLHYILLATFWFDIMILFLTIRAVIKREGAF